MATNNIFISAGELSGDIHGGKLVSKLLSIDDSQKITAIGGDNMQQAGASLLYHIRETSFMGISEIFRHLFKIFKIWQKTKRHIKSSRPDLIIAIDYPGFNLRLAKFASKQDIPVIYYISPKIWAWNERRIKKVRKYVNVMLCILPFEEQWYRNRGVAAYFIGNPLIDQYDPVTEPLISNNQKIENPEIGLFPGSRAQEIENHLPDMIQSIKNIRQTFPAANATIAMVPDFDFSHYRAKYKYDWLNWIQNRNKQIMENSDILIMASGTAVLEATIFNTPAVVVYRVSPFTYWFGRIFVNLDYISLPNIIAGKEVVPELIQNELNPENICREVVAILSSPARRIQMQQNLAYITRQLGDKGVAGRAANIIYNRIKQDASIS